VSTGDHRQAELAANLAAVRQRIAAAAAAAGRDPDDVHLVVITKTWPAADVMRLSALGVADVGENRDQEAAPKAAEVAGILGTGRPRWHFVGQLQRNKCRSVVRYADLVHSVDSIRLVEALDEAARQNRERPVDVLVQVSMDGDTSRGGVPREALDHVLEAAQAAPSLRLRGLMAVAPVNVDPAPVFADLALLVDRVRARYPEATVLSAGMSSDFEAAIRHGATHVRLGSAVLGNRPSL
jgi:pyridoxal phosphate enzyme (YggS family)